LDGDCCNLFDISSLQLVLNLSFSLFEFVSDFVIRISDLVAAKGRAKLFVAIFFNPKGVVRLIAGVRKPPEKGSPSQVSPKGAKEINVWSPSFSLSMFRCPLIFLGFLSSCVLKI
jgi:hypothetical protein